MKYRIISNGQKFIAQEKYRYWPFWISIEHGYGGEVYFESFEKAKEYIKSVEELRAPYRGKWKQVWP